MGITATVLDPSDMGSLERVLNEREVSLYFSESPTNPCALPPPPPPPPAHLHVMFRMWSCMSISDTAAPFGAGPAELSACVLMASK